jgi:hypothetical protein
VNNSKYGKYIVQELKTPANFSPERKAAYAQWAKRILWMDADVVPGAFQMNCSWYMRAPQVKSSEAIAHTHNSDEIIGFFGCDPADPYDLHGEVEFWLEDEIHIITSSAMIFVPKGMKHCPLILRWVDQPIFHFSVVTEGQYLWASGRQI